MTGKRTSGTSSGVRMLRAPKSSPARANRPPAALSLSSSFWAVLGAFLALRGSPAAAWLRAGAASLCAALRSLGAPPVRACQHRTRNMFRIRGTKLCNPLVLRSKGIRISIPFQFYSSAQQGISEKRCANSAHCA